MHSAGRQWQTPKTAADANIIRVTDSVIQVADKSSGGKKQRFLRGQEAWEDRATGPVLPRGAERPLPAPEATVSGHEMEEVRG